MALADYISEKPVVDTARLRLRPLRPDDVPALEEWMADKALYAYWGKGPGKTDKQPALLFARPAKPSKSFHLGVEEKAAGKVVGDLWVYRIENDRTATVAIRLAPSRQGRGFGTEALSAMTRFCFDCTELRHLRAEVDVRNAASRRMLEKCGYRREGPVRHGKMVSVRCDFWVYGIRSGTATCAMDCREIRRMVWSGHHAKWSDETGTERTQWARGSGPPASVPVPGRTVMDLRWPTSSDSKPSPTPGPAWSPRCWKA